MTSTMGDRSLPAVPTSLGTRIFADMCPPEICHVLHSVVHRHPVVRQVAMHCVLEGSGEQHVDADFGVGTVCVVGLVLRGVTGTRFVACSHRAKLLRNDGGPQLFYMNEPRYMRQSVVVHDSAVV